MSDATAGLTFVTCLLLGTGVGMLFGQLEAGGAIGLGLGIITIGVFRKR
ncbi:MULTISPECIES: hypothetical protein [Virgibacillus]|uniref:Uncharacterized protein n=2 Tax=Virgibacillus TaxID=84406 RepID=A0A024QG04_9BACI|nr:MULTISPECIES: hypothetical protein [Virgibacillus]EQB39011.1 hypothetical protein M948_01285 [Virgibacillus sp. CM-4]GGJ68295.1 hypothetical protein GCM10007111_32550 [Virgibacillus kapii]CDQ41135.1 hypothetical protein BN990_03490 [Virgibacillus massiliensis]